MITTYREDGSARSYYCFRIEDDGDPVRRANALADVRAMKLLADVASDASYWSPEPRHVKFSFASEAKAEQVAALIESKGYTDGNPELATTPDAGIF